MIEHYGRKCRGAHFDSDTLEVILVAIVFEQSFVISVGEKKTSPPESAKKCRRFN